MSKNYNGTRWNNFRKKFDREIDRIDRRDRTGKNRENVDNVYNNYRRNENGDKVWSF
jgi:hypothetical protein